MKKYNYTREQFEAMLPNERRRAIAQDVLDTLAKLAEQRYKMATKSRYLVIPQVGGVLEGDIQSALVKLEPQCTVCGQGAMFLSCVRLAGAVRFEDVSDNDQECSFFSADEEKLQAEMIKHFPLEMFNQIEGAFEGWQHRGGDGWKVAFADDTDRMQAICRNIIANDGNFFIDEVTK